MICKKEWKDKSYWVTLLVIIWVTPMGYISVLLFCPRINPGVMFRKALRAY